VDGGIMSKREETIIEDAKLRYKESVTGWQDIYSTATSDLKFVYDVDEGQWPEAIRSEREKDGRPIITVNKLQKFVRQLRGDQMMNRPRIKVIPVDSAADIQMAELYNGIIRQIEYLSSAEIAYDTAYMHAVSCSIGFFRIITKYADDNSFEQDIFIKRILNPMSVHYDPMAQEFVLSDARYCFIEDLIPKAEYKKLYPGSDMSHFDSTSPLFGEWITGDNIKVAEYFYKEPVKKKIVQLVSGEIIELSKQLTKDFIKSNGGVIVKERDVDTHKVMWCKLNGFEILEESEWPGKDIPIIPVFGDEVVVDGKRYYLSLARGAKGPQQMYNYWATAATENVALSPKAPFIVDHRQLKGFEREWEEANRTNRMYIRYNAIQGLNKPQRETQLQVPNAIMSMMQQTGYDIEDHLGQYAASKGEASNERSGKAITARIGQSDKGTYTFVDNLTRAIVFAGRQLVDLIPKIYDTPRALRIQGESGNETLVNVNQPTMAPDGSVATQNDLTVGKYDLIASIGASFSSKRQEMVKYMIESMQYAPGLANVIAPLVFKYSDFPGAEEIYAQVKQAADQQQEIQMQQSQATQIRYNPTGGA
jgi:hypothetical protein